MDEESASSGRAAAVVESQERSVGRTLPTTASQPKAPRLDRIARRAHEIYVARGGVHGKDLDDWLQAEREIDAED